MRDTWLPWDTIANRHMLNHIRAHPKRYAPDSDGYPTMHIGPETRRLTERLVLAKNAWAEDMRAAKPVPADGGKAWWDEIIADCDREMGLQAVAMPEVISRDAGLRRLELRAKGAGT